MSKASILRSKNAAIKVKIRDSFLLRIRQHFSSLIVEPHMDKYRLGLNIKLFLNEQDKKKNNYTTALACRILSEYCWNIKDIGNLDPLHTRHHGYYYFDETSFNSSIYDELTQLFIKLADYHGGITLLGYIVPTNSRDRMDIFKGPTDYTVPTNSHNRIDAFKNTNEDFVVMLGNQIEIILKKYLQYGFKRFDLISDTDTKLESIKCGKDPVISRDGKGYYEFFKGDLQPFSRHLMFPTFIIR